MSERHHFLISLDNIKGNRFKLNGSEGYHLSRVARIDVGDEIFLLDLQGNAYKATIESIEAGIISGTILDMIQQYNESTIKLHLGIGILKGTKMDMIVEKGAELGMYSITPLIMKFNIKSNIRRERLERIAESAVKQCGRGYVPAISEPLSFNEWCSDIGCEYAAVTDSSSVSIPIWEWLNSRTNEVHDIWLTVGPEGGYHKEELNVISEFGIPYISLGPRRLRSETAAIAALAICDNYFTIGKIT